MSERISPPPKTRRGVLALDIACLAPLGFLLQRRRPFAAEGSLLSYSTPLKAEAARCVYVFVCVSHTRKWPHGHTGIRTHEHTHVYIYICINTHTHWLSHACKGSMSMHGARPKSPVAFTFSTPLEAFSLTGRVPNAGHSCLDARHSFLDARHSLSSPQHY